MHVALPDAPAPTLRNDIWPILLGRPQRLFLCRRSRRRSVDQIVVSEPGAMSRPASSSRISASVMPGLAVVSSRSRFSCPASSGLRQPPIFAGAVLPVSRTRRISLTTADGLTSKRRAAARAELPCSTAPTSRRRRSWDKGAVITASLLNRHPPSTTAEPVQTQNTLGTVNAPPGPCCPDRLIVPGTLNAGLTVPGAVNER
jgi:hypothetical protein